jgi:hypothetical protein
MCVDWFCSSTIRGRAIPWLLCDRSGTIDASTPLGVRSLDSQPKVDYLPLTDKIPWLLVRAETSDIGCEMLSSTIAL